MRTNCDIRVDGHDVLLKPHPLNAHHTPMWGAVGRGDGARGVGGWWGIGGVRVLEDYRDMHTYTHVGNRITVGIK